VGLAFLPRHVESIEFGGEPDLQVASGIYGITGASPPGRALPASRSSGTRRSGFSPGPTKGVPWGAEESTEEIVSESETGLYVFIRGPASSSADTKLMSFSRKAHSFEAQRSCFSKHQPVNSGFPDGGTVFAF